MKYKKTSYLIKINEISYNHIKIGFSLFSRPVLKQKKKTQFVQLNQRQSKMMK